MARQVKKIKAPLKRRVVSAGGVVLKTDPLEVLVVSLRGGKVVTLPKGQVEPGERCEGGGNAGRRKQGSSLFSDGLPWRPTQAATF